MTTYHSQRPLIIQDENLGSLLKRAQTFPNASFGWVNVKDVANAHILAYETPSANGRYCLVESVVHYSEIVGILRKLYPSLQLPDNSRLDNRRDNKPRSDYAAMLRCFVAAGPRTMQKNRGRGSRPQWSPSNK
ncbi:hypothetical protein POM88_031295 [Heracleum sosnowskyi]|uniref:Uncharacterized protein n=1 Tax=Heracleum sosnowskyi TaxID=360622 RepID=A0AAD8HZ31_9APIA|nr:hypothetical protein POM88_031295 [Heracleum sosnowskyi]